MSNWYNGGTSTSTTYSTWTASPQWFKYTPPPKTPEQLRIEEGWDADDNGKVGQYSTEL